VSATISQCFEAYAAADPWVLPAPDVHWVMDLESYKRIRAAAVAAGMPPRDNEDDDDPGKWKPSPDDRLMAMPIEVREDGGEPHLVSAIAWTIAAAQDRP
jgi:hypothetical protein